LRFMRDVRLDAQPLAGRLIKIWNQSPPAARCRPVMYPKVIIGPRVMPAPG
jgi:hypothetical protein